MKEYKCISLRLENFLALHGLYPKRYEGETAIYEDNEHFQTLLEKYFIKYRVFKSIY